MSRQRVGRRQLETIQSGLTDRDLKIVETVADHRFLTTRQICRFCYTDKRSATAALRSANRTLVKLRDLRLLVSLDRRVGGVRAGSGSYVWGLGLIGARLLEQVHQPDEHRKRYREYEPSTTFLKHSLAVAEVSLRIFEATRAHRFAKAAIDYEPACWRAYNPPGGGTARVRPDLAVVTTTQDYEDHWFFEVDMATEPPSRVVRTCLTYQEYQRSGIEQHRLGLFPAVVWVVPSLRRKETIGRHLTQNEAIDPRLFRIITLDELEELIEQGAASGQPVPPEEKS